MANITSTPGSAIRVLRKASGMTIAEAANAAGVSDSQLSRVETGTVRPSDQWTATVIQAIGKSMAAQGPSEKSLSA